MIQRTEKTIQKPNTQELNLLKQYYKTTGHPDETVEKILQNSWFAAFESDPPKKLIIAIYSMVEFYETFCIENNKIQRIDYHVLTLDQSIHFTSVRHSAQTAYLQTVGYIRKRKTTRNKP